MADQNLNMEMIFKLIDQATPGLKQLQTSFDQLKASVDKASASQVADTVNVNNNTTATTNNTRATREATNAVNEHNSVLNTSAARYEALVLAHEALQGRWSRFGPSLMVMAERIDLIGKYGMAAGVALGALAAAVAAFVVHEMHVEQLARAFGDINAALVGTGKAAALTNDQIVKLVNTLSVASGVSKKDATDIITELARVPELTGPQIQKLSAIVESFAEVTGKTATAAAKELGEALAHPEKGAKILDEALNFLTASEIETVKQFVRVGEAGKAQDLILSALEKRLKDVTDTHTPLQKAVEDLTKAWRKLTGEVGKPDDWSIASVAVDKLAQSISFFNKKIEEGSFMARVFANLLSAIPFDPFNMTSKSDFRERPEAPNPAARGQITRGGVPVAIAMETKKAQEDKKAADIAEYDRILKNGQALESQATKQRHLNEEIAGYNKIVNSPDATAEQKRMARDRIQALEEQKAKMKNLRDEIEAAIARDIGLRKQLAGETDKQTHAELLLAEIQEGKYKGKYPQGQIDELAAKLKLEIADEKLLKGLQDTQKEYEKLANEVENYVKKSEKAKNQMEQIDDVLKKYSKVDDNTKATWKQSMVEGQISQNEQTLTRTREELNRVTDAQIKKVDEQNQKYLLTSNQLRDLTEQEEVRMRYEQKIRELKPTDINYEAEHTQLLKDEADALARLAQKQSDRVKFENDWHNGAIKAMNEFKEASINTADLTHQVFKDAFSTISGTIQNFMETGKLSFDSLATSFKKSIDKMVSDALAARLMNALFGDFNKTGSLGGTGGSAASFIASIFGGGREGGGPVRAGQAYIVGEKRPELFIPNTSGTIIPNVAGIGTTNPNVHINISALDGADVMKVLHANRRNIALMVSGASSAYNLRS